MIEIKNNQNLIVIYFASFAYESLFRIVYPGIKMTEEPFSLYTLPHTANIYNQIMIKLQPMVVPLLPFPGSSHWQDVNQYSLYMSQLI